MRPLNGAAIPQPGALTLIVPLPPTPMKLSRNWPKLAVVLAKPPGKASVPSSGPAPGKTCRSGTCGGPTPASHLRQLHDTGAQRCCCGLLPLEQPRGLHHLLTPSLAVVPDAAAHDAAMPLRGPESSDVGCNPGSVQREMDCSRLCGEWPGESGISVASDQRVCEGD